jgi:hypothetical protein
MANGEFEQGDSFGIDNGELDGLSPQECFVLGCEWQSVISTADQNPDRPLSFTVHASNKDRLEKAITRRSRAVRWTWPPDDQSEEWVFLDVAPAAKA